MARFLPLVASLAAPVAAQEHTPQAFDAGGVLASDFALAIGNDGTIGGQGVPFAGGGIAPVIDPGTGIQVLPILPGDEMGSVWEVGDLGQAVGTSIDVVQQGQLTFFFDHAVTWQGGQVVSIESLVRTGPALELFDANDVDDAGRIVGWGRDPSIPAGRGWLLDGGTLVDLGTLPGSPPTASSMALAINERGQVVGEADAANGQAHAFLWEDGVMTDLHDPAIVKGPTSIAYDVNDLGQAVGFARFSADLGVSEQAALWDPPGIVAIPTLGGTNAVAFGINDASEVVGTSALPGGGTHGFLWRDGVVADLNDLIPASSGWTIVGAEDVADDGTIVATGSFQGGALQGVVLVPIPCSGFYEPYGAGCAGSGGFTPKLAGFGCPQPGGGILLGFGDVVGGTLGGLFVGGGQAPVPIAPGCELQTLPLLSPSFVPFAVGGTGPGGGEAELAITLDPATPAVDLFLQALFFDPGVPPLVSGSNPMRMRVE